jgi:hypothetical protein
MQRSATIGNSKKAVSGMPNSSIFMAYNVEIARKFMRTAAIVRTLKLSRGKVPEKRRPRDSAPD